MHTSWQGESVQETTEKPSYFWRRRRVPANYETIDDSIRISSQDTWGLPGTVIKSALRAATMIFSESTGCASAKSRSGAKGRRTHPWHQSQWCSIPMSWTDNSSMTLNSLRLSSSRRNFLAFSVCCSPPGVLPVLPDQISKHVRGVCAIVAKVQWSARSFSFLFIVSNQWSHQLCTSCSNCRATRCSAIAFAATFPLVTASMTSPVLLHCIPQRSENT